MNINNSLRVVIYARVSTDEQELEHQVQACKRFCEYKQFEISKIYQEKISGMKAKRPEFTQVLSEIRKGYYDGLVLFRLDRLSRNSRELIMLIDEFKTKGIHLFSINESLDDSTAVGRFGIDLICLLAGLERDEISEATKQRLTALKAAGKRLGQKPSSDFQVQKVKELAATGLSCRKIAKQMNISHVTVYNIVNQKGYYSGNTGKVKI